MAIHTSFYQALQSHASTDHSISEPTTKIKLYSVASVSIDLTNSSTITLSSVTAFILFTACLLVFLEFCGIGKRRTLDARTSLIIFFLAALLGTVTAVCGVDSALTVYRVYLFAIILSLGLLFTGIGAWLFFDSTSQILSAGNVIRRKPIGYSHGNMGIVIWLVTLPLAIIEFALLLGNLKKSRSAFYIADYTVGLLQKLAQASIYYFSLRHRFPVRKCPVAAQWYFQILSMLNFILWEDSILTTHADDEYSKTLYGNGFSIVKAAYNSLLIDYRLMCCLIFLEHAVEIKDEPEQHEIEDASPEQGQLPIGSKELNEDLMESGGLVKLAYTFSFRVAHFTGAGYMVGIFCFALQVLNGLQYISFVGAWSNIMAMAADVFVIILGVTFLKVNHLDSDVGQWRETESRAIDAMVGIMGGVGFTFWIIKSFLTSSILSYYKNTDLYQYLAFTNIKNCIRAVGVLFQLYMYMRVSPKICSKQKNKKKIVNHFLVPALMLTLLAVFVSAVVDQYHGKVEKILSEAKLSSSVKFFLQAGGPIHLGFGLHMFLHFLIVRRKMMTARAKVRYVLEETSAYEHEAPNSGRESVIGTIRVRKTPTHLTQPLLSSITDEDSKTDFSR